MSMVFDDTAYLMCSMSRCQKWLTLSLVRPCWKQPLCSSMVNRQRLQPRHDPRELKTFDETYRKRNACCPPPTKAPPHAQRSRVGTGRLCVWLEWIVLVQR